MDRLPALFHGSSITFVIPAKAGIWLVLQQFRLAPEWQSNWVRDSGFRQNDEKREWLRVFIFPYF
jgi:hypothetical protein